MASVGGSLSATSHRGAGTTFALSFPLATAPHREPVPSKRQAQTLHRILIIDDEADNLDVLREVLEIEQQEVSAAKSGPVALALFDAGKRFDLVLCDVGMPEMSGWHVAREIQRIAPGTPVWMLTGWANEISEQDPRRQFVRGVLAKPIDLDQLRNLLSVPVPAPEPDGGAEALH